MKVLAILCLIFISAVASTGHRQFGAAVNHDLINEINNMETTWKAGVNERFVGKSLEEVKHLLGALKTPEEKRLPVKQIVALEDLPTDYDLRTAFPDCESLKEVRDQSNCGSCWAFGAVEAMSDRLCIQSGQKLQTRISAEDLVSCCFECGDGCNGGYPDAAWQYFQETGLVTGGLYGDNKTCRPYSMKPCDHHVDGKYGPCGGAEYPTPECTGQCVTEYGVDYEQDRWFASDAYGIESNEKKIMTEIYQNGSVEVALTVYEDFLTYKSGVYKHHKGKALGGHAVKCIGWGVENGTPYWLIVNSWNEGWGDNGTIRILRGSNECEIEENVVAGTVKLERGRSRKGEQLLKFLESN
jgi:cathepsin B